MEEALGVEFLLKTGIIFGSTITQKWGWPAKKSWIKDTDQEELSGMPRGEGTPSPGSHILHPPHHPSPAFSISGP